MKQPLPPFSCTYTPNIPELIRQLNITLVLSTYQAGKVIFLSAVDDEKLIQLPRTFNTAMGLSVNGNKLAVACKNEVVVLSNSPGLASAYPDKPNTYDALFVPRSVYFTGQLSLHDMEYGKDGLLAVNTLFSCISLIDDEYSFKPLWKPSFVSELAPEDRCHLNGMAVKDGKVKYVTALAESDVPQGWRENKMNGGILIDVTSGDVILKNLPMPHTPRIFDDKLYLLNSAHGELIKVDIEKENYSTVAKVGGFARGMARFGDYLFIGTSRLRHTSNAFGDLPIAESSFAGIVIVYLPMGSIVGHIKYQNSVEEIYDVKIIPGFRRPGILSPMKETHQLALSMPEADFWAVTEKSKSAKK